MKELVEYIARSLVDNPDRVEVTEHTSGGRTIVNLRVGAGDMGRVIGKQGRIAQAIRNLLKVAAVGNHSGRGSDGQPVLTIATIDEAMEPAGLPQDEREVEEEAQQGEEQKEEL